MLQGVISTVLFLSHLMKFDFHIFPGNGFDPSGNPIQEGNLVEQGAQLMLDVLHKFCKYSPEI